MDTKKLNKEYARLAALFKGVDKNKLELVDELLKKAAFLKCELDDLQTLIKKKGAVEFSNKGNSRQTPAYKTYLTSLMAYQTRGSGSNTKTSKQNCSNTLLRLFY